MQTSMSLECAPASEMLHIFGTHLRGLVDNCFASERRGTNLKRVQGLLPESQGLCLALTVLSVPYSFDSGAPVTAMCREAFGENDEWW